MPELPEVETVRRGLEPALAGKRITQVTLKRGDLRIPFPHDFAKRLTGQRVRALERRAKYILVHLAGGETLIVHLGMSGRFTVYGPNSSALSEKSGGEKPGRFLHKVADDGSGDGKHDHVTLTTEDGYRLVYTDHRRFGLMTLTPTEELSVHKLFEGLGPEPLSDAFTAAALSKALKGKRTPIKSALLDQRVVSGLGNIYVCEALHRAHVSPKRLASSVSGARAETLVPIIKAVLEEAIAAGGSTLRDYAHADGELGYFQHSFGVYGREGEPCATPGCKGTVKRLVQAGRSTFYCRVCQR